MNWVSFKNKNILYIKANLIIQHIILRSVFLVCTPYYASGMALDVLLNAVGDMGVMQVVYYL